MIFSIFQNQLKNICKTKEKGYIPPSRTLCVTENVFPVSSGTVQFIGSGDRTMPSVGDFTRVGSGGDLTTGSRK